MAISVMDLIKSSWTFYYDEAYSLMMKKINEYITQWNLQLIV
jgi:hypothetical protein